jgi:hypothetical protein
VVAPASSASTPPTRLKVFTSSICFRVLESL